MKYLPSPGPTLLASWQAAVKAIIEYLSRELRRISQHNHDDDYRWDDMSFPATAINPPGLVSDPDWDVTAGGWRFDPTIPEYLHLVGQLSHKYVEGSTLRPHVHWEKTVSATGDVAWELHYQWSRIGEPRDAELTLTASSAIDTLYTAGADTHIISSFGDLDATSAQISDMLIMKLYRNGGAYGSDARLLEFDVHVLYGAPGSETEFAHRS